MVLAAGESRRLGRPKQMLLLDGETLLARTVRVAREAGLRPIVVVLASDAAFALTKQGDVIALANPQAAEGMAASVRCGVAEAAGRGCGGAVLMTCDQPAVTADHLRALYAEGQSVKASRYAGRNGVPAFFPRAYFGALQQLQGDQGARALLRDAAFVEDERLALDVDSEADWVEARRVFSGVR